MDLTAFAGLTLVSETMLALGLDEVVRERLQLRERHRGHHEFDKLHALVLVQAAGGDCVEDVRILARDAGLVRLLARPLPSPDALHDVLGAFHEEAQFAGRPAAGVAWIPDENAALPGRQRQLQARRGDPAGPRALEPFNLFWLEIDNQDPRALAQLRRAVRVPMCWASSCSPCATFQALNLCASVSNVRIMESDPDAVPRRDELFTVGPQIVDGHMTVPTAPGWGTELNEAAARKRAWTG